LALALITNANTSDFYSSSCDTSTYCKEIIKSISAISLQFISRHF